MRRLLSGAAAFFVAAALLTVLSVSSASTANAAASASSLTTNGYWTFGTNGKVSSFGSTPFGGSPARSSLNGAIVSASPTVTGNGYWLTGTDGGVFSYGDAKFFGSTGNIKLNRPVVGMSGTADSNGYWFVATDGGVFAYGNAPFLGSMGGSKLNQPIVGMAATPDGGGYWLVASDGGIFAYGDAKFFGSTGSTKLNKPIVGMTATPSGGGYWLVASDGGIFSFGDAAFHGSTGAQTLNKPIVGMAATPSGGGYWLVAADGGVFTFGDSPFMGSSAAAGGTTVAIAALPRKRTAETSIFYYPWYATAAHDGSFRHWDQGGNTPPDYIAADYWPLAGGDSIAQGGSYSSADVAITTAQMRQIKAAGIDTVIISWWGRGSWEDSTLATLIPEAKAVGLRVAIHIEPYGGRDSASVATDETYLMGLGVTEFYLYQVQGLTQALIKADNDALPAGVRVFAESATSSAMKSGAFETWAAGADFTGVYTYAGFGFSAQDFNATCDFAHAAHLLCSPSVSPGFSGVRASPIKTVVDRKNGATYDASWKAAINSSADIVSITSFNEWHEGTQIEPAVPHCMPDATCDKDYTGAYSEPGDAHNAYLDATAKWTAYYKSRFASAF